MLNIEIEKYIPNSDVVVPTSWKCIRRAVKANKGPVAFFEQGGSHLFEIDRLSEIKRKVVYGRMQLPPFIYTVSKYSAEKIEEI